MTTSERDDLKVTAVAPWYGSNRMLGKEVGRELAGCEWVGVPFAGGMAEVPHIEARTINVNDTHELVMNLAMVMGDLVWGPKLLRALRRLTFHPSVLANAQSICRHQANHPSLFDRPIDGAHAAWALSYFVCAWMTRHGSAGTPSEFSAGLSTRWNSGGGDSAVHYRSAIASINALRRTLRRCNFTVLDFRAFLAKCKDQERHGIYCDPPFPGPGDKYSHKMSDADHRELARTLAAFKLTRVVCRFYDVRFIRELYPEPHWHWRHLVGRKQTNGAAPEVLITRN